MEHGLSFWIFFHVLIAGLLAIDLYLFHRKSHEVPFSKAVLYSLFWILTALLFNFFIYLSWGKEAGLQFLTGYLVEKSLSVDNLFLFLMIFTFLKIGKKDQHRVLFWGILGALVFRLSLILAGIALIQEFHWILYLFGLFLIGSAIRLIFQKPEEEEFRRIKLLRFFQKILPLSKQNQGGFFVREEGKIKCTYLFVTLLMIESFDIIFALDSIPAIFAITTDPFIVYTSNVFAILGLRALYFVIAPSLEKLRYLKFGLGAILVFIGIKMLIADLYPISLGVSLLVVVGILLVTIATSFFFRGKKI